MPEYASRWRLAIRRLPMRRCAVVSGKAQNECRPTCRMASTDAGIRIAMEAGNQETADAPVCRGQREGAERMQTDLSHDLHRCRKACLSLEISHHDGFLVAVDPRGDGFVAIDIGRIAI